MSQHLARQIAEAKAKIPDRLSNLEAALKTTIDKADSFFANAETKILDQGKKNAAQDAEIIRIVKELAFLQHEWLDVRIYLSRNIFYRLTHRLPLPGSEPENPLFTKTSPSESST